VGAGWVGYHPQRILTLFARAVDAHIGLGRLSSDAPEAADALRAVRAARMHLEDGLLAHVQRIVRSDVLLTPVPAAPLRSVVADDIAELARTVLGGDGDALDELHELVSRHGDDAWAMREVFAELGGRGTADLLATLGSRFDPDDAAALAIAESLRRSLGDVSTMLGVPTPTFADDLIARCVELRAEADVNTAATLSFVLRSGYLSTDLRAGLVGALLDHERASREREDTAWPGGLSMGSVLNLEVPDDDLWMVDDPRYAAMASLAADGDAARAIFTDPSRVDELVSGRTWDDGLRGLLAAGAAASQVPADARPDVQEQAAVAATQLVNRVGGADLLMGHRLDPQAAESAATVLSVHMLAVQATVSLGRGEVSADELDSPELATVPEDSFGRDFRVAIAVFGTTPLAGFTRLAASAESGVATLRAGLSTYQAGRADGTARVLADDPPSNPGEYLDEAMFQSGELEGYFVEHVGHEAERQGRSRDSTMERWIDIGTLSLWRAEDAVDDWGAVEVPFLSETLRPAAAIAKRAWADHEAGAARNAEHNAIAASDRLTYQYYEALVAHGVMEPPSGVSSLPPFEGFEALPMARRIEIWTDLVERFPAAGEVSPNGGVVELSLKTQQLPYYQELD